MAFLIDIGWMAALYTFASQLFEFSPVPHWKTLVPFLLVILFLWMLQQTILRGTLGQLIWNLRLHDSQGRPLDWPQSLRHWNQTSVYEIQPASLKKISTAAFLTFVSLACTLWATREVLWKHPLFKKAEIWHLTGFSPTQAGASDGLWSVLPIYYTMGVWPKHFQGNPILPSLPYEQGPPKRFVGKIQGRWRNPDIRMTATGPFTPIQNPDLEVLKTCITSEWLTSPSLTCARYRDAYLGNTIAQMRKMSPAEWELRWFEIENPRYPVEENPRGIYIRGTHEQLTDERFLLIQPKGSLQTFALLRNNDSTGKWAETLFHQSIRSLRVLGELQSGKALADGQLAAVQLRGPTERESTTSFIARIAESQALLLSKITVDPAGIDPYYHLAGTALLMIQHAAELRLQNTQVQSAETLAHLDTWTAAAKPLIQSAYRYAKDIAPEHPHVTRLEQIWVEAKKY